MSDPVIRSVAKKLRYYFELRRLEDGFDLSTADNPRPHHPPLKSRPTLQYDGLHDRPLKHYYSMPAVRRQLTYWTPRDDQSNREAHVKKRLDHYIRNYRFADPWVPEYMYKRKRASAPRLRKEKCTKEKTSESGASQEARNSVDHSTTSKRSGKREGRKRTRSRRLEDVKSGAFLGGYPLMRSVPTRGMSRGEAQRIVSAATRLLVATETVDMDQARRERDEQKSTLKKYYSSDEESLSTNSFSKLGRSREKSKGRPSTAKASTGQRRRISPKPTSYDDSHTPSSFTKRSSSKPRVAKAQGSSSQAARPPHAPARSKPPVRGWLREEMKKVDVSSDRKKFVKQDQAFPRPGRKRKTKRPVSGGKVSVASVGSYAYSDDFEKSEVSTQTHEDETPPPKCRYEVIVLTGNRIGASSQAEMRLVLHGSRGTRKVELDISKTHRVPFQKGQEDIFAFREPHAGEIKRIGIGHDRMGMEFGWFGEKVTIRDLLNNRQYEFQLDSWFNSIETDGKTFREFSPSSSGELASAKPIVSDSEASRSASRSSRSSRSRSSSSYRSRSRSRTRSRSRSRSHSGSRSYSRSRSRSSSRSPSSPRSGRRSRSRSPEDSVKVNRSRHSSSSTGTSRSSRDSRTSGSEDSSDDSASTTSASSSSTSKESVIRLRTDESESSTAEKRDLKKERDEEVQRLRQEAEQRAREIEQQVRLEAERRQREEEEEREQARQQQEERERKERAEEEQRKREREEEERRAKEALLAEERKDRDLPSWLQSTSEKTERSSQKSKDDDIFFDDSKPQPNLEHRSTSVDDSNPSTARLNAGDTQTEHIQTKEDRKNKITVQDDDDDDFMEGFKAGVLASQNTSVPDEKDEKEDKKRAALFEGTTLHEAAAAGDINRVTQLVTYHPESASEVDERGWNALHIAATEGETEVVKFLSVNGPPLEQQTPQGYTAAHLAAMRGHVSSLMVLSAMGLSVNQKSTDGMTPLHLAAMGGHSETCKWLVGNRASLQDVDQEGRTPYHLAKTFGHAEVAQFLSATAADERRPSGLKFLRSNVSQSEDSGTDSRDQALFSDDGKRDRPWSGSSSSRSRPTSAKADQDLREKRREYDETQRRMKEEHTSFLDYIRQDATGM